MIYGFSVYYLQSQFSEYSPKSPLSDRTKGQETAKNIHKTPAICDPAVQA